MKRIIIAVTAVALILAGVSSEAKPVLRKVVYATNLHCENCAKKIRENVAFERGVKDLNVDAQTKTVEIQFDPAKTDTTALRKSINKLGYQAVVIEYK